MRHGLWVLLVTVTLMGVGLHVPAMRAADDDDGGPAAAARATLGECNQGDAALAVSGLGGPNSIAVAGNLVYWADGKTGAVGKFVRSLQSSSLVAENQGRPFSLLESSSSLLWLDRQSGDTVVASPSPQAIAVAQVDPLSLLLHEGQLYWIEEGGAPGRGRIKTIAVTGDFPVVLADGLGQPSALAADERGLYFSDLATSAILFLRYGETTPVVLLNNVGRSTNLVIVDERIYWGDTDTGRIFRAQKNDGRDRETVAQANPGLIHLAAHAGWLAWTNPVTRSVLMAPLEGPGAVTTLTRDPGFSPCAIAWDADTTLFWTDFGEGATDGALRSIGLPPLPTVAAGTPACPPGFSGSIQDVVSCELVTAPLTPMVDCVSPTDDDGRFVAYFGFTNRDSVTRVVPVGAWNYFVPADADRCQPTAFGPGTTSRAFRVESRMGEAIEWHLGSQVVVATLLSTRCEP